MTSAGFEPVTSSWRPQPPGLKICLSKWPAGRVRTRWQTDTRTHSQTVGHIFGQIWPIICGLWYKIPGYIYIWTYMCKAYTFVHVKHIWSFITKLKQLYWHSDTIQQWAFQWKFSCNLGYRLCLNIPRYLFLNSEFKKKNLYKIWTIFTFK